MVVPLAHGGPSAQIARANSGKNFCRLFLPARCCGALRECAVILYVFEADPDSAAFVCSYVAVLSIR
eukprot:scaffold103990_cov23-Prasinocladus_malaysianus.AAC.2